jgi:hypothetical protein
VDELKFAQAVLWSSNCDMSGEFIAEVGCARRKSFSKLDRNNVEDL